MLHEGIYRIDDIYYVAPKKKEKFRILFKALTRWNKTWDLKTKSILLSAKYVGEQNESKWLFERGTNNCIKFINY